MGNFHWILKPILIASIVFVNVFDWKGGWRNIYIKVQKRSIWLLIQKMHHYSNLGIADAWTVKHFAVTCLYMMRIFFSPHMIWAVNFMSTANILWDNIILKLTDLTWCERC